jgi:hypothetical protein
LLEIIRGQAFFVVGTFALMKLNIEKDPQKTQRVAVRVSPDENGKIQRLADSYTGGDVSKFIRYAVLNFRPRKADLKR